MKNKNGFILLFGLGLLAACLLLRQASAASSDDNSEHSPRLLVHLLDYLAVDYGGAVKKGKVLSVSEYKEQLEFIKTAVDLSQSLPETKSSPEIQALMRNLSDLINSKSDPEKVASLSRQIQSEVIDLTHLPVAPTTWPNLASGKQLFLMNCAKCHGESGAGNGPSAATLSPKPVNLLGHERMDKMAPFQVFNAIRLGVPNTAMAAFPSYSDQDTWDMAFYAISLRHQTPASAADSGLDFEKAKSDLNLSSDDLLALLAKTPDVEIEKKLSGPGSEKADQLAALRIHSSGETAQASLDFARFNIQESLTDYQAGRFEAASRKALKAYVEGVEPVEPRLKANDPQAVLNLEQLMGLVRSAIGGRKPSADVQLAAQKALDALAQASEILKSQAPSPWLTFTLAFGILLREGFEAVLLIVALLGVIRASGAKKARRWVHGGWMAAVALGILAWFFSGWLMNVSGLGRELMEGLTGALTVVILLYIGFWLHSRTEINRWKTFIEVQVKSAVEESNLIQLAFISFLAAFREAIETVLFLRAIWLEGGSDAKTALALGVIAAFASILILGWLLLTFSARIPIKALFNASSIIMITLAVILTGKAVHSFQEVDMISITLSPLNLHWDWLGLYPTRETLLFQLLILALSVFLWAYGKKPPASKSQK